MRPEETFLFPFAGRQVELHAFYLYTRATAAQRCLVCNGAGPRRFGWLVPDTICGLCITEAANLHDWDFQWGETIEDFHSANRTFKNNMLRLAEALRLKEAEGNPGWLRRKWNNYMHDRRCEIIEEEYFKAVEAFGGPIFWKKRDVGFSWKDLIRPGDGLIIRSA